MPTFFFATHVISWCAWLGAAFMTVSWPRGPVFLLGTFAPGYVALWLVGRSEGRRGVTALIRRLVDWDVSARWYAFAIGYMLAIKLAAALLQRLALGAWPLFGNTPWYVVVGAVAVSTPVQAGEEIGWRGYALPRLSARFGLARASLLLGIVWAAWHLPLFLIPGVDNYGQSFTLFLVAVTALSVAMAWLYLHTNGSLLLVMLMHSAIDQTFLVIPSANPTTSNPFALTASLVGWLTAALLWVGAAYLLVRIRQIDLRNSLVSYMVFSNPHPVGVEK